MLTRFPLEQEPVVLAGAQCAELGSVCREQQALAAVHTVVSGSFSSSIVTMGTIRMAEGFCVHNLL